MFRNCKSDDGFVWRRWSGFSRGKDDKVLEVFEYCEWIQMRSRLTITNSELVGSHFDSDVEVEVGGKNFFF